MSVFLNQTLGTDVPASANPTNPSVTDEAGSTSIIIGIIGAVLTLASVVVAILQYRSQRQRVRDAERDSDEIEMRPPRLIARRVEGTPEA